MEFNEKELLDFVLKNDIINVEATLEKMELMERRDILALHPYKITERPDYYATYITGTDGKRKYRIRHTRKEIEDLIISCYKDKIQEIYLKDVFLEWVNKKLEYNEIQRTSYDRYINDYKRFFEDQPNVLSKKRFKNITEDDIEAFIKVSIRDLKLSRKSYAGLRTLLYGIFRYGKRKKLTNISISEFMKDLELPRNMFKPKVIEREKEVFMEDETCLVVKYLRENPDIYNLGILLVFETGMRVGELAALSPYDIGDCVIKIRRTEVKYRDENGKWVATDADSLLQEQIDDREVLRRVLPTLCSWRRKKSFRYFKYVFADDRELARWKKFAEKGAIDNGIESIPFAQYQRIAAEFGITLYELLFNK